MKAKGFMYKGYWFEPIGNIMGGWFAKGGCCTWQYTLEVENYSWADFYKVAKKNHASCDLYMVNGKLYIPASKCFMGVYGDYKLKKLDEYERWYH